MEKPGFEHIRPQYRPKVAADYLAHITPDGRWNLDAFDTHNDYQRHLFALHLRLAGKSVAEVSKMVLLVSDDVSEPRRASYVEQIVHSEIVGFPWPDGSLLKIPDSAQNARFAEETR